MKKKLLFLMLSVLTLGAWADDTYTPLEWIDYTGDDFEHTRACYYETGYTPNFNTRVEFLCQGYTDDKKWRAICYGRTSHTNGFSIYRCDQGNQFGYFVGGSVNNHVGSYVKNTNYRIVADVKSMLVNGINVQSTDRTESNYEGPGGETMTLFSGKRDRPFKGRIYYFNIYEGNELKHAFVPVLKNGTTPCFKCTVCNDYKEPVGSGFGYNQLTYTPVEYIEYPSNGAETPVSRTFDTGYVPNENTKVVTKFMANANGNWSAIFSGRNNEAGSGISLYKNSNNTKLGYFVGSYKNDDHADFSVNTIYTAVCKLDKLKLNGTDHTTNNPSWVATTRSITLFSNPEKDQIFRGRIYSFDIYENDALKHHFIPVKASDNSVGFYDLVDRKYITTRTTTDSQYFTTSADKGGSDVSFYAYNGNSRFSEYGFYSNMFDGDLDTKWEAVSWLYYVYDDGTEDDFYIYGDDNGNALFAASEPIYVNGLTLYTAGDTKSYPKRNPYEWSLYGTNDVNVAFGGLDDIEHSGWEPIERVGRAQMPTENKTGKYYKFNPSQTAYKYFRFHVHRLVGKDELQLAELELDYSTTAKASITEVANGGGYGGQGADKLFDGPSNTKWCRWNDSNKWVVFKTVKPIYASSYIIQTGDDEENRDPKVFKLYGALDAAPTTDGTTTGWTEIDSETDASASIPTDRYAFAEFTIDVPGVYQYFMLKVDETRGSDGSFQLSELILDNNEGYAIITSDEDMAEFVSKVNSGSTSLNAFLFADINSDTSAGTTSHKYTGTFDGQGHTVNLRINGSGEEYHGLIGCATGGAVIQNVITTGYVNGSARCGGILGGSQGSGAISILNCGNEANITTTGVNAGGVHGCNNGSGVTYTLTNCYNTGTITGSGGQSAAISGWLGNGATVTNCYNIGAVTGDEDGRTFARSKDDNAIYNNCYTTLSNNHYSGTELTANYSMDKVRSGELCVVLGNAFTQDLSDDNHPTFGSKAVSAGQWFSNSNDVYYNLESGNYTVYQLNLNEENTKYAVPENVTATNVSVARNIPAGQWIGLCLPFDYDIPSGWDVREMTGVSGSGEEASMKFTTASTIEAGKPYIVKPTEAVTSITATGKAIAESATDVSFGGITMKGRLKKDAITTGDFYINTSSELKKLTAASATLKGFRAYFTVDGGNGVKALSFDFDDDATGIEMVNGHSSMFNGPIYNVAGQRLNKMQKGINIVNGKKIMVK